MTAATLGAHDFWLVPDAFQVTPGGTLQVRGQTSSSFPTSESAVTVDRVADARLIGADALVLLSDIECLYTRPPDEPGARPIRRTLARLVEAPLAEMILRGDLPEGSVALLDVEDGKLIVDAILARAAE